MVLLLNEFQRFAALWRSYRWSTISSLVVHIIIFPILMMLFDNLAGRYGSGYGSVRQLQSLLGFLVWYLCMKVIVEITEMVEDESIVGTLENIILAPKALGETVMLRTIVIVFRSGFETTLLGTVLSLLMKLTILVSARAIFVMMLLLLSSCGIGFALAGLALIYKSVSSITNVIGNLALLLSGALVPLDGLGSYFVLLKYGFPMTWGIMLLRKVSMADVVLASSEVIGLTVQTVALLMAGGVVFFICLQKAKVHGLLAAH